MNKAIKLEVQAAQEHLKQALECIKKDDAAGTRIKFARASDAITRASKALEEETGL